MPTPRSTWRSRVCGVMAVAAGIVCLHGISMLPWFRDWAATDLLHGWSVALVAGLIVVVVLAAPLRAAGIAAPAIFGLLSGSTLWWMWFAVFQADLLSRNDQHFAVLVAIATAVALAKLVVGPRLLLVLARRQLRRDPRGSDLLKWDRAIVLGPVRGHLCRVDYRWWHWLFQLYNQSRCFLRIGPSRSSAIEKAIEESIDRESRNLRRMLDGERTGFLGNKFSIQEQTLRAAAAGAAYLDLVAILEEAGFKQAISEANWIRRTLEVWDLIRFAEDAEKKEFVGARTELLLALERQPNRLLWLSEVSKAARCENPRLAFIDRVLEKAAGQCSLPEHFAAILLADLLADLEMGTWALGLLEELRLGEVVAWMRPSMARVQLRAEEQILRHERSLEEADCFVRQSQCERAAVLADSPLRTRREGNLLASWRGVTVLPVRRGTLGLPGIARPRFDPGPGRGLATAVLTAAAVCLVIAVTSQVPVGPAFKPLADLHRSEEFHGASDYHKHALTAVVSDPKSQDLLVSSFGGGLHRIDTRTFRIRTATSSNGGPSTNFLMDVAASSAGHLAVVTSAEAQDGTGPMGLDVRGSSGWQTLIAPRGVPGLNANDISFVQAVEADKLLIAGTRVLKYRTQHRELLELLPDDDALRRSERVVAVAASQTDAKKLWVAVRDADQRSRVLELSLRDEERHYSTNDITGFGLSAEAVKGLVFGADRLWASTESGRLYQRDGQRWSLRIDGDTGLDLGAVRHAIVGVGDPSALWLTDRDKNGAVRSIRARILPDHGVLPPGPWRRLELGSKPGLPLSTDLRLGADDGTPVAWFDAVRGEHVLAVPGRNGDLWCFRASQEPPESLNQAVLSVEKVETPGERIWSIDLHNDQLACVLESLDGTRRRVIVEPLDALNDGWKNASVVQQSVLPEKDLFRGTRLLAVRDQKATKRLDLFTDHGRVLTYDLSLHGLTRSSGTLLVDDTGRPVEPLRGIDTVADKFLAVTERGRIVESELPARIDAVDTLSTKVLFEPSTVSPPANLEPMKIATEPDGIDLLMAESGSKVAWPWKLSASTAPKRPLVEWTRLLEKPLQLASLTRLQDGDRIGPQIALDELGQLHWRSKSGWKKAEPAIGGLNEILPAVGATFYRDVVGLRRIALTDLGPVVGETLWTKPSPVVRLPITAVAAIRGANPQVSPICLVVGHADGLARYDLSSRTWKSLTNSPAARWNFLSAEDTQGISEHVWALKYEQDKVISQALLVKGNNANIIANAPIAEACGAGDAIGLLFADGRLALATPNGVVKTLIHEKVPDVGDVTLKRLALADRLYAVDSKGRLISAAKDTLWWRDEKLEGSPFRDLETTANGALLLVADDGQLLRRVQGRTERVGVVSEKLERVVSVVAAGELKSGRLEIFDQQGRLVGTAAGGRDEAAQIGDRVVATLTDGDDLFVAGPRGMVWRNPDLRRCVPVLNGEAVGRLEKLGAYRIAWKENEPFLLSTGAKPQLTALGNPGTDTILAPDGSLWVSAAKNGAIELRPYNSSKPGLFESESVLGEKLTQAAPLANGQVVLKGKSGDLLLYDTAKRRMELRKKGNELPSDWRFAIVAKRIYVVPSSSNRPERIYRINSNPVSETLLETRASHVLEFSNGLAWLDDNGSLRHIDAQGKDQILVQLPVKQRSTNAVLPVTQVMSGAADSLWFLSGTTAFEYGIKPGEVTQSVSNVSDLVRVGKQVAAVRKAPNAPSQLITLGANLNLAAQGFERVRGGNDNVLTWGMAGDGTLNIQHHRGVDPKSYRRRITLSSPLASDSTNRIAAVDDRFLWCRTDKGALVAYDTVEGGWIPLPNEVMGWDAVGRIEDLVLARRRTATGSEVMALRADAVRQGVWDVPGAAWFFNDGFARLIRNERTIQIVKQRLDGTSEVLRQFDRLSNPFIAKRSFVIESRNLKAALVCTSDGTAKAPELFLVRSDQSVTGLSNIKLPPSLAELRVFEQEGEFVFLDAKSCLVRIAASSGETSVGTETIAGLGLLGKEPVEVVAVLKEAASKSLSIRRIRDRVDVVSLLSEEDRAQHADASKFQFVMDRTRHLLQLKAGDGALEPPGTPKVKITVLSLADEKAQLDTVAATEVTKQAAHLRLTPGTTGLLVQKRLLQQDGWFSDQYALRFAAKSDNRDSANTLPLEMRDNSRIVSIPVKDKVSATPPEGLGGFTLVNEELRSKDGRIRYGRLVLGGATLACDVWTDARPVGKDEFITLDSLGQTWAWTDANGTLSRRFIELPTEIRDSRRKQLLLAASTADGLVLVDEKNSSLARISPKGEVIPDKSVVAVVSPAQRSGQLGPIVWERNAEAMPGKSSLVMSLAVKNGESKSVMPIRMTDSGLDVDAPIGLRSIDGEKQPWLHLGRASDGREIVCPPIAVARLQQARSVGKFAALEKAAAFRSGSYQFVPRDDEWEVQIGSARLGIAAGRFAIDNIRGAATVKSANDTDLYLATVQPGVLIRQRWRRDLALDDPELIELPPEARSIRTWNGELVIQTVDSQWHLRRNGVWSATTLDWGVASGEPSSWKVASDNAAVNWKTQPIPFLNDKKGFGLVSDVVTDATETDGALQVRQAQNGDVVFRSVMGDWFSWRSGQLVAMPTADVPPRDSAEIDLQAANVRFPRRSNDKGVYSLHLTGNAPVPLPMRLASGRLPHHQVKATSSWNEDGIMAVLAADFGSWHFDSAALRAGNPPRFSTKPLENSAKPPSYDQHDAVELSPQHWLRWTRKDREWTFEFAAARAEKADSSLGTLTETGLSIDDSSKIRPLEVRDGRLKFAYRDQLWSRSLRNALADFTHDGELPFGSKSVPGVDPQTGRFALGSDDSKPTLSDPKLGQFLPDGRFDAAKTVAASIQQMGSSLTLRLQQAGDVPFDLVVTRDAVRWSTPFDKPRSVLESVQRLLVLDGDGTSLGVWHRNGQLNGVTRSPAPITAIWRDDQRILARLAVINEPSIFELRVPNEGVPTFVPSKPPDNEFVATTDTFALRRSLGGGSFDVVSRAAEEGDWQEYPNWTSLGFPGSRVDAALWFGDDGLLCQDGSGIRRLDLTKRVYSSLHRPFSDADRPLLDRHAGKVVFGRSDFQLVVRDGNSPNKLEFAKFDNDGLQKLADWEIRQPRRDQAVSVQAVTGAQPVMLGPARDGALLIDRVQVLSNINGSPALVMPAGISWLGQQETFQNADQEVRSIIEKGDLRLLSSETGDQMLAPKRDATQAIHFRPSLSVGRTPADAVECLYVGRNDDWRVFHRDEQQLVLERPVSTPQGRQVDRIEGDTIFSKSGQFSFDRVVSVAADANDGDILRISTERATETVRYGPNGPTLEVSQLGVAELQRPDDSAALPIATNRHGQFQIRLRSEALNLSTDSHPSKPNEGALRFGTDQLPRSFQVDHRAWIVEQEGIHWLESAGRWSRRRRELQAK